MNILQSCNLFVALVSLVFVLYHLWFIRVKAFVTRKRICTHFCKHLAQNGATLNTLGPGIFVLAVIFDYLNKHAIVCIRAFTHTHTHITPYTMLLHLNTQPSIQLHTHVHSCGYYQQCSAEAPGLSGPYGVAVTRGGRAYLGPRPLPRPQALAPGAGKQMPCEPPVWHISVANAYSVKWLRDRLLNQTVHLSVCLWVNACVCAGHTADGSKGF